MKFAVDTTSDKLEDVLRVLGAAYGVEVAVQGEPPVSRPTGGKRPRRRRAGAGAVPPTGSQIRAWAKDNGWEVSGRGALPRTVVAAYREAHGSA